MRMLSVLVLAAALPACTGSPGGSPDLAANDPVSVGRRLVDQYQCPMCHDPGDHSMSGQTTPVADSLAYGANLTLDETGIAGWSDTQIARAIREGIDNRGEQLCPTMPRFDIDDQGMAAIIAYLQSLSSRHSEIPDSVCPPIKNPPGEMPDGGVLIDDAGAPADLAAPDGGAPDAGVCTLKINEVQTAGAAGASDEFVELYNPCGAAIDVTNMRFVYRSAFGSTDYTLIKFTGGTLPAGGHAVLGNVYYTGGANARYGGGLAASGGGVAMRSAAGAILDSVAWGSAKNGFEHGTPAPAPPSGQSTARHPDGRASGNDAADFVVGTPSPGMANP